MKKHNHHSIEREERLRKHRTNNNQARKDKVYDPNKPYNKAPKVLGARVVRAPRNLDLARHKDHSESVKLIHDIRHYCTIKQEKVRIDFSLCKRATVPALVYLYANLQILRDSEGAKLIRINITSASGSVKKHLKLSGIAEMLSRQENTFDFSSIDQPPVITGFTPRHDDIIDHIQNSIYEGKLPAEEEGRLGDALSEVFLNVLDHAYPESKFPDLEANAKPWWAAWSILDDQLWLVVFDTGVGIPRTIKEDHWAVQKLKKAKLIKEIMINDDADKIELAMKEGQNRRGKLQHGQGSASMHALVKENPNGELWVFSGQGRYSWYRDSDGKPSPKKVKYTDSIHGTIIQWNISINLNHE